MTFDWLTELVNHLRPSFWWDIAFCPPCPNSKNGDFINKLLWGKCNFLRIWLYYITLQKYDRFHLCLMKWPNRMLRNFSYFLDYTKNSWFLFLNECGREKELYQKDGKFWSLSLDNFIKHVHLNFWRVWLNILLCIYINKIF